MTAFFRMLLVCFAGNVLTLSAEAQNNPVIQPSETDDAISITTELVQLDAIVTDKDGNQITGLKAEDFEVFQDGKLQKITSLSYINTKPSRKNSGNNQREKNNSSGQTEINRPGGFGRIITFVIDNGSCLASQMGISASRESLEKFVNEQMQTGDLVAVFQTRSGASLLQQYTSDKTQLRQIIGKISRSPARVCDGRGSDLFEREKADYTLKVTGRGKKSFESDADREVREELEDSIRDNQTISIIETLRVITRRLKTIGGRKIIFFLSDGLPVAGRNSRELRSQDFLRELIAEANQSAIVFNTVDIRGQFNAAVLQANDEVLPEQANSAKPTSTDKAIINRITEARNSQNGLAVLAYETGGSFARGRNFPETAIKDLLDLEKGYYLLTYEPEDGTFRDKKYHQIEIRLKRPDWRLLSRAGISANTDEVSKAKTRDEKSEILDALNAPLPRNGLNVRLDAYYGDTASGKPSGKGHFINSIIRLKASDINFTTDSGENKKAVLDVTVVLFDENYKAAESFSRRHTIRVSPQELKIIEESGLTYPFSLPVKDDGIYSLRVAVRDATGGQIGSASRNVEVPDLKKKELFFPLLTLYAVDKNNNLVSPDLLQFQSGSKTVEPAIPGYQCGAIIAYGFTLYNPQIDKTSKQPKLSVQLSVRQNGKTVFEVPPQTPRIEAAANSARIDSVGYLQLPSNLKSGEYTLRVFIKDLLTGKTAEQLVDFDLID